MKKILPTINRLIFIATGLLFVLTGINKHFTIFPVPPPAPEGQAFIKALYATGYMMHFIAGVELLAGLMLLFNFYTAAAGLLLLPVSTNILLYHLFIDKPSMPLGIVVFVLNLWILVANRKHYTCLFRKRK